MLLSLVADFKIIFERDPAARNFLEVLFCYPGLQALVLHRFSHTLYQLKIPVIPRLLSQIGRWFTGVEIHPGATIGKGVFIDHGMGVVIGETAIVGDYALIYQGVTLGGTGKESGKRHPTLGENVVVGAGAKVLGNIYVGNNVRIGAGSVVLRDVPSDCTVVGVPGRVIYRSGVRVNPLEHGSLPDSEAIVIRTLLDRIEALEQQVQDLQITQGKPHIFVNLDQLEENCLQDFVTSGVTPSHTHAELSYTEKKTICSLRDKEILQFFDGAGI